MDVSIIIVNYNTKELTVACIASVIEKTEGVDYEIILVDNASSDGTVDVVKKKFPNVIIRQMDDNVGFGRANNAGAELAKGKYLFLLNSDTILIENVVKKMCIFLQSHNGFMACGCDLIDKDGNQVISHGCLPSPLYEVSLLGFHKIFPSYFGNYLSLGQKTCEGNIRDTGYISGADIFIRKKDFDNFGGFDANIFMYFEETDLFYRMKRNGGKFCVLDDVKLIHLGGASLKTPNTNKVNLNKIRMFEKSHIYYYKKNYNRGVAVFVKLILCILALLKCGKYRRDTLKILSIIINI